MGYTYATHNLLGTLTHVFNDRAVNETRLGHVYYQGDMLFTPVNNPRARVREGGRRPFNSAGLATRPCNRSSTSRAPTSTPFATTSLFTFSKAGRHTLKTGAEFLLTEISDIRCVRCEGLLDATGGPVPAPMERIFPDILDATTWNLDLLSPVSVRWRQSFATSKPRTSRATPPASGCRTTGRSPRA